jgi:hypothetical protein
MIPNLLKNWTIERYWNGSVVVRGEIYNDTKNRFPDGTNIRTSSVQYIDFVAGVVRTLNSVYNLEREGAK